MVMILLCFLSFSSPLSATSKETDIKPQQATSSQEKEKSSPPDTLENPINATPRSTDVFAEPFPLFDSHRQPGHIGHYVLLPWLSQTFPGFGQLYYGQYSQALTLSGVAMSGIALIKYSKITTADLVQLQEESKLNESSPFLTKDDHLRYYLTGAKLYGTAGDLSAYHSFRTAVRKNPKYGDFSFLTHEESLSDILYAPLRYEFLSRPSTLGTLALAMVGLYTSRPNHLNESDGLFTASVSLMAGTGEEAFYRGWLQPVLYHYTGNSVIANALQAGLFFGAHSPGSFIHFLAGLWFGHLTQKNNWTLSESVFIHTWWDVLALSSAFITSHQHPEQKMRVQIELPTIFF
ncbi:MAG: lysostaphin resistance A-like protein [Oligoflexales bacterium]